MTDKTKTLPQDFPFSADGFTVEIFPAGTAFAELPKDVAKLAAIHFAEADKAAADVLDEARKAVAELAAVAEERDALAADNAMLKDQNAELSAEIERLKALGPAPENKALTVSETK